MSSMPLPFSIIPSSLRSNVSELVTAPYTITSTTTVPPPFPAASMLEISVAISRCAASAL